MCVLGMLFGLMMYTQLKSMPVHRSMREISELIYETCKTYLITQGKFILLLEVLIGSIIIFYFWALRHLTFDRVAIIFASVLLELPEVTALHGLELESSLANSRTAFASLKGKPYPTYDIPLKAGMSIGMLLIRNRTRNHALHLAFHTSRLCRTLFHRICNW